MIDRGIGLTKLYNLLHDPSTGDADIHDLREIQKTVDQEVARAYGWEDLDLTPIFSRLPHGQKFAIPIEIRREIIDRLLELNQIQSTEKSRGRDGNQEGQTLLPIPIGQASGIENFLF
jgi:hypothetical protein